jgi:hypothetical protein
MGPTYDVCVPASCTNGMADPTETTVDCGGDCGTLGPCGPTCPDNGQQDTCTASCLCAAGWGHCDSDAECQAGLVCATDNGPKFGMGPTYDVCVPASCTNGVFEPTLGETMSDCGGTCGSICPCMPGSEGQACGSQGTCSSHGTCVGSVEILYAAGAALRDNENDGVFDSVYSGIRLAWRHVSYAGQYWTYRGAVEFSLSQLPTGAVITDAGLLLSWVSASWGSGFDAQFRTYSGDGRIDLADAYAQLGPMFV